MNYFLIKERSQNIYLGIFLRVKIMEIAPELLLSSFCYPWRLTLKNYKETKIGFDFHYEHTFVYLFQSLYFFTYNLLHQTSRPIH